MAKIYLLQSGTLRLLERIDQPPVGLKRQTGRFEHRVAGALAGFGEVLNAYAKEDRSRFLRAVKDAVGGLRVSYERIFLFAPPRIAFALEGALPPDVRKKVARRLLGNYTKQHETKLLSRVRSAWESSKGRKQVRATSSDALKILKRTHRR